MNTIVIVGQLGRDPELKTSQKGKTYLQNAIYEYVGKDEDGVSIFLWRDFVAYGTAADKIARLGFRRGRLMITGQEREKTFTDKNGILQKKMEVSVDKVDIIDFREKEADDFTPQGFSAIAEDIPF